MQLIFWDRNGKRDVFCGMRAGIFFYELNSYESISHQQIYFKEMLCDVHLFILIVYIRVTLQISAFLWISHLFLQYLHPVLEAIDKRDKCPADSGARSEIACASYEAMWIKLIH